ncbi:hypothetical protein A3A09_00370 [Candidatus Nomurabacteria bacterium RIFCSPLOWO2_01_FULL_42_20]|uniref:THIF-type NAD/FAD binding fold domain-containing protein n=1 Tax=Candidatus Nomurabacteria bacterium RIFCSPHIGHO2_01_FULL_42_16 TaxID=1801743 RepID=A0A1F6VHZ0_9BACT|nr:MAG: hypothetical protein A2824_02230 [Candidatus Nomurabacteria bacterium RIFCSPHIGHO2_01_FULL_42_16]OGI92352.1 MAG: hypothetical protein A3A09_00370 [Candidatus Nomurabacteria bacterium RIFCSPLOWO2_01_FULL_42_20]
MKNLKIVQAYDLPGNPDADSVYELLPKDFSQSYYDERTDRNIGWITREEQEMLKNSVVGIAGCGGMGGALAQILLRLGIGEIRIADCESFDISNINRQFAANRTTVGKSKAFETARLMRNIAEDTRIVVYPMGIRKDMAEHFASGCHSIIDEIEFWELAPAIILHRAARSANVDIFGCNTSGFGTHLFRFTPSSMAIEEAFGVTFEEAERIDSDRRNSKLSVPEMEKLTKKLLLIVAPEIKNQNPDEFPEIWRRLFIEGKAPIISTNPSFATGFVADHVLLHLLSRLGYKNNAIPIPPMPGYAYLDARKICAVVVNEKWW